MNTSNRRSTNSIGFNQVLSPSSPITSTKAAPSACLYELPAVTQPFAAKAGLIL
jgi:hypothetical protein